MMERAREREREREDDPLFLSLLVSHITVRGIKLATFGEETQRDAKEERERERETGNDDSLSLGTPSPVSRSLSLSISFSLVCERDRIMKPTRWHLRYHHSKSRAPKRSQPLSPRKCRCNDFSCQP